MNYEVIREIKNSCSGNQMRDVFFEEIETDDPVAWIRAQEPLADELFVESLPEGIRCRVFSFGLETVYTITEV